MIVQYQPRSSNAQKASSNWEKKSQYLLTEIVKYESYIDTPLSRTLLSRTLLSHAWFNPALDDVLLARRVLAHQTRDVTRRTPICRPA